ncbi:hypothetical protein GMRT_11272 [Giardia muris]|uniref:Uncharacterized protein n=1 Tax=Giardia muris TaxID=5742 RepID=A0A4Z1SNQ2_GIAMU|nr:hypothetical protein GMRT_11272 [Giardia muris]|eukprot:TNJ27396.1 hypothetical protein GMRT_11272 [Giardia muris]
MAESGVQIDYHGRKSALFEFDDLARGGTPLAFSDAPSNPSGIVEIIHLRDYQRLYSPQPWAAPSPVADTCNPILTFPNSYTNSPFIFGNPSNRNSLTRGDGTARRLSSSFRGTPLSEAAEALFNSLNEDGNLHATALGASALRQPPVGENGSYVSYFLTDYNDLLTQSIVDMLYTQAGLIRDKVNDLKDVEAIIEGKLNLRGASFTAKSSEAFGAIRRPRKDSIDPPFSQRGHSFRSQFSKSKYKPEISRAMPRSIFEGAPEVIIAHPPPGPARRGNAGGNLEDYSLSKHLSGFKSQATTATMRSPVTKAFAQLRETADAGVPDSSSIQLGERLLANCPPSEMVETLKKIIKQGMVHRDADHVYHFTKKLVGLASTDGRVAKEITDYIRLLEEHGRVSSAASLLVTCATQCLRAHNCTCFPEQLIMKALRLYESIGDYQACQALIEQTTQVFARPEDREPYPLDKYWRVVFFGAYLEMIHGHVDSAREVIGYIIHRVKEPGPVIMEYVDLEIRHCSYKVGFEFLANYCLTREVVYAPLMLFFAELLCRTFPQNPALIDAFLERSASTLVTDVQWRLRCMSALYHLRLGMFGKAMSLCQVALDYAKEGVEWRILVVMARIAFYSHSPDVPVTPEVQKEVLGYLLRARDYASVKSKPFVLLEMAHYYEFWGMDRDALDLLLTAIKASPKEWKYTMEYVLVLRHNGRLSDALESVACAIQLDNSSTGRLWALYASLAQYVNAAFHFSVIRAAAAHCPKSADVWIEIARFYLNPTYDSFSLSIAEEAIAKAVYYTPQYGDTYIEWLRLITIKLVATHSVHLDQATNDTLTEQIERCFHVCAEIKPTYGLLWNYVKAQVTQHGYTTLFVYDGPASVPRTVLERAFVLVIEEVYRNLEIYRSVLNRASEGSRGTLVDALSSSHEPQKVIPTEAWQSFNTAISTFDRLQSEALSDHPAEARIQVLFNTDIVL